MYTPRRDPADRNPAHTRHAKHNRTTRRGSSLVETLELRRLLAANWFDGVPLAESGSLPQDFVVASHTAFFTADDGTHGRELWKTDGSPGGTSLVKDTRPGSDGIGTPTFTAVGDGSVKFVISEPGS